MKEHISNSKYHYANSYNCHLQNAIRKYGKDVFIIEAIEECEEELLNERETFWITFYDSVNNGYNLTYGGEGTVKYSNKEILDAWNAGGNISKVSSRTGIAQSTLSERLHALGITSEEINERRYQSPGRSRPVYQYSLDGMFIKEFPSCVAAEREIGCRAIKRAAKELSHTAGGYQWREYKTDHIEPYNKIKIGGRKKVYQYTLDGVFVRSYASAKEAALDIGKDYSHFCEACKGKTHTCGRFIWSYEYYDKLPPAKKNIGSSKAVEQYSLDGNFIALYTSATEAARKYKVDMSAISAVCNGKAKTSCGYIWRYAENEKEVA